MKLNSILTAFLIVLFLNTSVLAGDMTSFIKKDIEGSEPTVYLPKGKEAPFNGYLVTPQRIQKVVEIATELDYQRKYSDLQDSYYVQKLKNVELEYTLAAKIEKEEREAVEGKLKKDLAEKSVWYKQPWFTIPATAITVLLFKVPVVP
jgi:hypothetical protein